MRGSWHSYHLDDDAVALYEELNKRYDSFLTNFNVSGKRC